MTLLDIIKAALVDLDRGTDPGTIEMYTEKFTAYANEACREIANRFKVCREEGVTLDNTGSFDIGVLTRDCSRITRVRDAAKLYDYYQPVHGGESVTVRGAEPEASVLVEYRLIPLPMKALDDVPDLPAYQHMLIPLYVRAREQCGQDPSTQGTSSAFFSLFNAKIADLEREARAMPDSFKLDHYHFD